MSASFKYFKFITFAHPVNKYFSVFELCAEINNQSPCFTIDICRRRFPQEKNTATNKKSPCVFLPGIIKITDNQYRFLTTKTVKCLKFTTRFLMTRLIKNSVLRILFDTRFSPRCPCS